MASVDIETPEKIYPSRRERAAARARGLAAEGDIRGNELVAIPLSGDIRNYVITNAFSRADEPNGLCPDERPARPAPKHFDTEIIPAVRLSPAPCLFRLTCLAYTSDY